VKNQKLEELEKEIELLQCDRTEENLPQNQQQILNAIQLMLTKHESKERGYRANSAAQLIRELKELVAPEEALNPNTTSDKGTWESQAESFLGGAKWND
jgi:hypothetical protein